MKKITEYDTYENYLNDIIVHQFAGSGNAYKCILAWSNGSHIKPISKEEFNKIKREYKLKKLLK